MLYPEEVMLVVKLSEHPITVRKIAKKLSLPRKVVTASLYAAKLEDSNLTMKYRNPESLIRKRPIWSYQN